MKSGKKKRRCPYCGLPGEADVISFFGKCYDCEAKKRSQVGLVNVKASKKILRNLSRNLLYRKLRGIAP